MNQLKERCVNCDSQATRRGETLNILVALLVKWAGEAANYAARTDDDYTAYAMMLRYCQAQLECAIKEGWKDIAPSREIGIVERMTNDGSIGTGPYLIQSDADGLD